MILDRQGNIIKNGEGQDNFLKKLYGTSIGRCALKILVSRFVTNIGGLYMNSFLSKRSIKPFISKNNIDMSEYENKNYTSYNDFFTRKIKPGKRPFDNDKNILISPADSKLTYYKIDKNSVLTIKDTKYTLTDLLRNKTIANEYLGGTCLVFRLTVDDYHRYSFIDNGTIIGKKFIKGIFHTVNPIANDYYPIYKTNSRAYNLIETENFDKIIQMEVGAMMVGKIVNHPTKICTKGEEKGFFEFGGSTVVVLLKENVVEIDQDIIDNSLKNIETRVKLGETIGKRMGV